MTPESLMKAYPHFLDHLMAETILKAHEAGTLMDYVKDIPERTPGPPQTTVLPNAITVENFNVDVSEQPHSPCEEKSPS